MYRALLTALFVVISSFSVTAGTDDWTVAKAGKQVSYTIDKTTWRPAQAGDVIPNQAWISTGPKGRALIVRGVESIAFQPNTIAGLFTRSDLLSRKTEIVQQNGIIDLEIEKRGQPHTTVQTPFLAAVVKGTSFRVSVSRKAAKVTVDTGLVQVTSFQTGQRTVLGAGQSALVDAVRGMSVAGVTTSPTVTSVAPSTAKLPAVGATAPVGPAAKSSPSVGDSRSERHNAGITSGSDSRNVGSGNPGHNSGRSLAGGNPGANGAGAAGEAGGNNVHGNNGSGNGNGGSNGNNGNAQSNANNGDAQDNANNGNGKGNNGQGNGNGGPNGSFDTRHSGNSGNGNGNGG